MLLKLDNICKTNAYGSLNKNIFLSIILTNIIYGKEHKQCAYKRNIEMRSLNQCRPVKAIIIIYSECVSGALVMLQADACAILSSVASLALFPHYLIKGTTFGGKQLLNVKCVLILAIHLSETFLILRKIKVNVIINVH